MSPGVGSGFFEHDGFRLAYVDQPAASAAAEPVLLIHGFASSLTVNWVSPGWMKTLGDAGYRVVAIDNRGHGNSSVSYQASDYAPQKMASDAAALLDHLCIGTAHVFGYSMGARISAYMALGYPQRVRTLIFGGLGIGMVDGVGDWTPIADALLASDPTAIAHRRGRAFRTFADQTHSDRQALAACISYSRQQLASEDVARISRPVLVAVGTRDDIGGAPGPLATLMPDAVAFEIEGRDHMLAVGDRSFKARVVEFLRAHPIA